MKEKKFILTKEYYVSYENARLCYICNEKWENKYVKDKKYCKVVNIVNIVNIDHCYYTGEYRGAVDSICNLKYSVPKNSSNLS